MKRYEGLFILNLSAREEALKEAIDKITAEITSLGGKIETVQKMDKRAFARVADKKHGSGFYVNVIFSGEAPVVAQLRSRFTLSEDVFRALFTVAPPAKAAAAA